ncbi:23S rRNA (adenine(2030)-N(6))-methyltransferase RlmJ [Methylobacterium mesophilicum]|uniref:23S rRNA (adenine(2030)-N(6))-methyltransferase RlmJ n=1 Tax=Methylobacterium mesophilicum TaxID=39956 RepID=UPI002F31285A
MNYRHAFHAGNHTEVFKHAALVEVLRRLMEKPKPVMVLDTHAGPGIYDLGSEEASRTGEASSGIMSVLGRLKGHAAAYASLVAAHLERGNYPGSPAIVADLLRVGDRSVACELHPADAEILRRNFLGDRRVATHHRDGYEALTAFVPPPERRGLVFVDPPFEDRDEAGRMGRRLSAAVKKWPTGTYMAWYPVKRPGTREAILDGLLSPHVPDCLWAEFLRFPPDGVRLAGSGLILINAPWRFDDTLRGLGADVSEAFGMGTDIRVEWAVPPR